MPKGSQALLRLEDWRNFSFVLILNQERASGSLEYWASLLLVEGGILEIPTSSGPSADGRRRRASARPQLPFPQILCKAFNSISLESRLEETKRSLPSPAKDRSEKFSLDVLVNHA